MPSARLVLTNVVAQRGSPYLVLWHDAVVASGRQVRVLRVWRLIATRHRDAVVHIQWPEWSLTNPRTVVRIGQLMLLLVRCFAARALRRRVLVTAHNVWSHESRDPRLERVMWRTLGRLTTDLHVMSEAGAPEFVAAHPGFGRARLHVVPHVDFGAAVTEGEGRDIVRERLGAHSDETVFLMFGALKTYKGAGALVDAFTSLPAALAGASRLVVAGRVADDELEAQLSAAEAASSRVVALRGFVEDAELYDLIRAADAVVLPYRKVLNSGSALLALTLDCPVVLPRTPTFEDLSRRVGPGWVHLFDSTLDAEHLAAVVSRPRPSGSPDLSWCSASAVAARLRQVW